MSSLKLLVIGTGNNIPVINKVIFECLYHLAFKMKKKYVKVTENISVTNLDLEMPDCWSFH